jgi:hypothetical protein
MARGTRALPGVAAAWGPLVEIRARRPAGLVGTMSHRPFPAPGRDGVSPSVPWAAGRGGDGPWDTGPTGGGSGLGPLVEIRARRPAGLVGTVSHRPVSGPPGKVGMARGTRALPGGGSGLGPLVEIWARRPAGLVGTVSHRPFPESSVPWATGRGGDGPWDTGPTGSGSGLKFNVEPEWWREGVRASGGGGGGLGLTVFPAGRGF